MEAVHDNRPPLDNIESLTLFVDDLERTKEFYGLLFSSAIVFEDAVSVAFRIGGLVLNLLLRSEGTDLVEPRGIGLPHEGAQAMLTVKVDRVDATCAALSRLNVALVNGPIDRPWGRRTATLADPSGHIWEVAQTIDSFYSVETLPISPA